MASELPTTLSNEEAPDSNDIVIALLGRTGSGKSSLVSLCTDQQVEIGRDLQLCTQDVRIYAFSHPKLRSGRVYLVDTPGFDDTSSNHKEVLQKLAAWLETTYSSCIKLSGILYLHRNDQKRLHPSVINNLSLFESLFSDDALKKVVLVTTMWDIIELAIAESQEKQLKEELQVWGGTIVKEIQVLRHNNSQKSAFALIETFMNDNSKVPLSVRSWTFRDRKSPERTDTGKHAMQQLHEPRERKRHKRESQSPSNPPDQEPHSSTTNTVNSVGPIRSSERSSRRSIARTEINYLFSNKLQNFEDHDSHFDIRVSPDGSCLAVAPLHLVPAALFSTETGEEIERYTHPSEMSNSFWLEAYSSDGQALALLHSGPGVRDKGVFMARRGEQKLQVWDMHDAYGVDRSCWSAISTDFETTVAFRSNNLVLVLPTKGTSLTLEWDPSVAGLAEVFTFTPYPVFAKQDQVLVCYLGGLLHFWDTQTGQLLRTESVVGFRGNNSEACTKSIVSPNSVWLAISLDNGYSGKATTSFFRLSGPLPEFITSVEHRMCSAFTSTYLSFDGTYFAARDESQAFIFHVLTGRRLLSHDFSEFRQIHGLCFFPCDNRLISWNNYTYHVWELESSGV
ncbi:hypothetical protein GGR58DRAFT_455384 [Xylaria digitata]|nr:hypothetical protein GGR58DRAFT_455384 [Xylaria digitata]